MDAATEPRPAATRDDYRSRPAWRGGDLPRGASRDGGGGRHHPQGGLPLEGPAGGGWAMAGVGRGPGADEGRSAADGVGVPDAAEPAIQCAIHERGEAEGGRSSTFRVPGSPSRGISRLFRESSGMRATSVGRFRSTPGKIRSVLASIRRRSGQAGEWMLGSR